MVQLLNKHSGFRPYVTHSALAAWFFFWMVLIWWRVPLLTSDGWEYYEFLFASIGPLLVFLTWTFVAPQSTNGDAAAARAQYFGKAPQIYGMMILVAAWAIVFDAWLVGGGEGAAAAIAWAVALVFFIVVRRSTNARLHGAAVILLWLVMIGEFAVEASRSIPV